MGRPPAVWLSGPDLAEQPPHTVVAIDVAGRHRPRLVGRILRQADGHVMLRTREALVVSVDPGTVKRFRILDHVFPPGKGAWDIVRDRAVIVLDVRDEDLHEVEDVDGERWWVYEGSLRASRPGHGPLKRGPVASDLIVETVNAAAVADRAWAE